jgi:NAD(P)-dependent dehydrogenase (short-subunit alcohol dehydrogenase family)
MYRLSAVVKHPRGAIRCRPGDEWSVVDIPNLSGRRIVVTGASSGLGAETARVLAAAGAHVVLAVRDTAKGARVADGIDGSTEVRALDLADLESVRAFAAGLGGEVDVLVNNAGIMAVPLGRTRDGFELQIGTNHLGHFALTALLLPQISDRVVTVSSGFAGLGRIDLDDLNWGRRRYGAWRAYAQSKLANLLFTSELDRRLTASGSSVRALAAHPGLVSTPLRREARLLSRVVLAPWNLVAGDVAHGALPTLAAATHDLPGGLYVGPDARVATRYSPAAARPPRAAIDHELARRLWALSAELTAR